ncbi:MAG: hypothetical protein H5T63_05165, partial [Chloroflexi bacterium]|nr:hypothetical protein [Chloroflexota bacterium]
MRQKFLRFLLLSLLMLLAFPLPAMGQGESVVIRNERTLEADERIVEDIVVLGGTLHSLQDSEVLGNLVVIAGEADLAGKIDGDVVSLGGSIQLGPTAEVTGDVVVLGTLRRHPEATIYGNVIEGLAATSRIEALPRDWLQQLVPPASEQTPSKSRLGAWLMGALRTLAFTLGLLLLAAII